MQLLDLFPVVVLYRCQLQSPFRAFMVYDNSPSDFLFDETRLPPNAVYQRNLNNGGVSAAYNCAAAYASEHGFTHLLLLDQDTHFPENALSSYLASEASDTLVAPRLVTHSGVPFSPVTAQAFNLRGVHLSPGEYDLTKYSPVNCGMCISLAAFHRVGGYNPRVAVFPRFRVLDLEIEQDFSNDEQRIDLLSARFSRYLNSARAVTVHSLGDRLRLIYQIAKHTLALSWRTRSVCFLKILFRQLLCNSNA